MAYGQPPIDEPHQPREHEGVAQEGCGEGADDARAARGLAAQSVGQRGAGHRQRVREEEQCAERIARPVRQAHLLKERAGDHEGERQPAHDGRIPRRCPRAVRFAPADSGLVSCCISPPSSFPVFYSTRAPSSGQVSRACKTHSASEGRADGGVRMFHVKHSRSDAGGPRRGRHRDLLGHHSAPAFLLCSGASFGRWRASPRVRDALLTVRFPCAAAACSSARPRPYWKGSRSDKEQAWKA